VPTKAATPNPLSQFNACLQPSNKRIEWIFDETVIENNVPLWTVKLFVDGDRWGYGRGSSKKVAKNEAAKQGLTRLDEKNML
jgi:ribonuclease-3